MKNLLLLIAFSVSVVSWSVNSPREATAVAPAAVADTVYTNGKIYTVNEKQPWAEAVAIKDGRFIVVGSNDDVEKVTGDDTEVMDLKGAFAMPGVQETHVHFATAGQTIDTVTNKLSITETMTPKEIQAALVEYAKANPGNGWIQGQKWGNAHFENGRPHKSLIDEVVPDRPVILIDETNHNAVVNSKALALAGITRDTPQPVTGVIYMDPDTGEPTGYLAEMGIFPVMSKIPPPPLEKLKEAILLSQQIVHAYGVTAIKDMSTSRSALEGYKSLDDEGKLKLRVDGAIIMNGYLAEEIDPYGVIADRDKYRTRLIDPDTVKYVADGTPMSGTSIMLEPYANNPESRGIWTLTEEQAAALPKDFNNNLMLSLHSVGDGTTRKLLDIIEKARADHPEIKQPVQIAHPVWVHPDDMKRMKDLNVMAEVSPPLYFWSGLMKAHIPVLGEERVKKAMPIAEFIKAGVHVSYGSDWPAGTPNANPLRALEGMVTRQNPEGEFAGEILGEAIDLATAIKILTINGAVTLGHADITGSIEVGKYADMAVLDHNPFDLAEAGEAHKIGDVKVSRTLFEGEVVFDRTATIEALEVVDIEITNKDLDNAVGAAELDLIIQKDLAWGAKGQCFPGAGHSSIGPGSKNAPEVVNRAFGALESKGFKYARHAREIEWKKDNTKYWIQWTLKDDIAVLWAFDPEVNKAVEVLRLREK